MRVTEIKKNAVVITTFAIYLLTVRKPSFMSTI